MSTREKKKSGLLNIRKGKKKSLFGPKKENYSAEETFLIMKSSFLSTQAKPAYNPFYTLLWVLAN